MIHQLGHCQNFACHLLRVPQGVMATIYLMDLLCRGCGLYPIACSYSQDKALFVRRSVTLNVGSRWNCSINRKYCRWMHCCSPYLTPLIPVNKPYSNPHRKRQMMHSD